eukprot:TRINITY_DN7270_c0_g1_i2.p1 TRINITY_DN7270_c0_g1~~TRINITY_DN7270_c0_g1_i2.p1  ORF type:complete len:132 (-),score=11.44 TRINITY_DN7270_c0_g1_i2:12-407(-)
MRLLSLGINKEILDYIVNNELYICDNVHEVDDAVYHSEVRYYNLILIKHDHIKSLKKILKQINARQTAVVFIVDEISKKDEVELLQKGAIDVIKGPVSNELLLAKMKSIHRENFESQNNKNKTPKRETKGR